jgi:hypothetical protein
MAAMRRETSVATAERIRACDEEVKALERFAFPPLKPLVAAALADIRETRSGAEMAALFSEPEVAAALFEDVR